MPNYKIKLYKNSKRNISENHEAYVPQYQILGVEPEEYKSPTLPNGTLVAKSNVGNPRTDRISAKQPYAEVPDANYVSNTLPNIGNSMEQTWVSVDGEFSENLHDFHDMIDDNHIDDNLGTPAMKGQDPVPSVLSQESDIPLSVLKDLKEQSYLLIVNGVCLCSGDMSEVEDQAKSLVFGDHPACKGVPVSLDNIIIIKRVPIKVGLFLE